MKNTHRFLLLLFLLPSFVSAQALPPEGVTTEISKNEAAFASYETYMNQQLASITPKATTCTATPPLLCSAVVPEASQAANTCSSMHSLAAKSCAAQTYGPYIGLFLGQAASAVSSGGQDQYKQCKNAALMQAALGAANLAIAGTCAVSHKKCTRACETLAETLKDKPEFAQQAADARKNAELCGEMGVSEMGMIVSGMSTLQGMLQSQACQKAVVDECTTPEASTNPKCTYAFCANPTNKDHPTCKAMWDQCTQNPATSTCVCLSNPADPSCSAGSVGLQNNLNAPPPLNAGANIDDFGAGSDQGNPIDGGKPGAKAGLVGGNGNGGGGGGNGGNPLGGGPGGGGGPGNKPVYDTNVMGGVGSSAGGGGGYPSAGGGYNGGAAAGGYNGGTYKPGSASALDLKKYLPGGAMAQQRDLANLNAKGITPANGLTNWEKVTRSLNNNRSRLVNP